MSLIWSGRAQVSHRRAFPVYLLRGRAGASERAALRSPGAQRDERAISWRRVCAILCIDRGLTRVALMEIISNMSQVTTLWFGQQRDSETVRPYSCSITLPVSGGHTATMSTSAKAGVT